MIDSKADLDYINGYCPSDDGKTGWIKGFKISFYSNIFVDDVT